MQQLAWSFVAMEYYAVILNRTFTIEVNRESLDGFLCRGLTSVNASGDYPLVRSLTNRLSVHGDLNDPRSYVDDRLLNNNSRPHFSIRFSDICSIDYKPGKKWGMGYYPHDGRVLVTTAERTREFIILGKQSGQQIFEQIETAVGRSNNSFKPKPLRGSA